MHRAIRSAAACLVVVSISTAAIAQQPPVDAELARKIDGLIVQLDSDEFAARESAEKALRGLGEAAREQLQKASGSTSAEVRQRAMRLLRELRAAALGLRPVGIVQRPDLRGACGIVTSSDGKFFYVACLQAGSVGVFRRDTLTGSLEHVQTLTDPDRLVGAVCIKISPDGKTAATVTYTSKVVALWARDPDNGTLAYSSSAGPLIGDGIVFGRPVDGGFSPDGKYLYAVDGAGLAVLEVRDGQLKFVEFNTGRDDCLQGARSLAISPDGRTVLVTSNRAGTLSVLSRDPLTGKVEVRQVLKDGEDKITALLGAHGVVYSPDGKHAYVSVGRHLGDQAIGAYRVEGDKLALVQELVNGQGELVDFQAPNGLNLSPDGLHLYVCGTNSQTLACFRREPQSGELSLLSLVRNETTGASAPIGAADVDVSPDGRFVHVALEGEGAISIFERTIPQQDPIRE
jgi:6-phosphogluconolactonase (cycloisomerase 2 family)